jgi:SAM-dependent methyltransferase
MIAPCGCVVLPDPATGVLRSASRCPEHMAARHDDSALLGPAYYAVLGALSPDAPARYVAELEEALGPIPPATRPDARVLEVGCGASPYVPALLRAGYGYLGLDPSRWACRWLEDSYGVGAIRMGVEEPVEFALAGFDLILAAHVFEHVDDAPGAIRRCAGWLVPGGELWVIVPDDSDLGNPDHVWFFTEGTLRGCLEAAGLEIERMAVRRIVAHENFLYARARKP